MSCGQQDVFRMIPKNKIKQFFKAILENHYENVQKYIEEFGVEILSAIHPSSKQFPIHAACQERQGVFNF